MSQSLSRRHFLLGSSATAATLAFGQSSAHGKVFRCKQFHNQPADSPLHQALVAMWADVKAETHGKYIVETYPQNNSIPGSDPEALQMLLNGELEFFTLWGAIIGTVVPVAEIQALPYLYQNRAQVLAVMDGPLNTYLHREMASKGIYGFPKGCFENGFRQISTRTRPINAAHDIVGMKIRVPDSAVFTDFFKTVGAIPQVINFGNVYQALKQGEIDGQDNPIQVTISNQFYQVQTYLSFTNHMWSGFNLIANLKFWQTVPSDVQEIVQWNVVKYVGLQRQQMNALNQSLANRLSDYGLKSNQADFESFRAQLGTFYQRWKAHFGMTAWDLLESQVGKLG